MAAVHIDGSTPDHKRVDVFRRFKAGSVLVLSSVGVLSEVRPVHPNPPVTLPLRHCKHPQHGRHRRLTNRWCWWHWLQGFDEPRVAAVLLLRPTASKVGAACVLWVILCRLVLLTAARARLGWWRYTYA